MNNKQCSKSGFGIMEVLAAAVVLGFLIVGLTVLQKGNRESILRVRSRDAANYVAQYVLDSLGSLGVSNIKEDPPKSGIILVDSLVYKFEGNKDKVSKNFNINQNIKYDGKVLILDHYDGKPPHDSTTYTISSRPAGQQHAGEDEENLYAKSLEAIVSWKFKNSTQSIKMAKVVR